jgi:hypothetical protein
MTDINPADYMIQPPPVISEHEARQAKAAFNGAIRAARPPGAKIPIPGPWVAVPIEWLTDRRFDAVFDRETRTYLYILHKTNYGRRVMRFTSECMAELGLTNNKMRELRRLEAKRHVAVTTRGTAVPVVRCLLAQESKAEAHTKDA